MRKAKLRDEVMVSGVLHVGRVQIRSEDAAEGIAEHFLENAGTREGSILKTVYTRPGSTRSSASCPCPCARSRPRSASVPPAVGASSAYGPSSAALTLLTTLVRYPVDTGMPQHVPQ